MTQRWDMFIDGGHVGSSEYDDIIDPATEEVVAQVARGDLASADIAVRAARAAHERGEWPRQHDRRPDSPHEAAPLSARG